MKKIIIVAGVIALIYYTWSSKAANVAAIPKPTDNTNGTGTLNNPVNVATVGGVTLGPSFAIKVPGVASVS